MKMKMNDAKKTMSKGGKVASKTMAMASKMDKKMLGGKMTKKTMSGKMTKKSS